MPIATRYELIAPAEFTERSNSRTKETSASSSSRAALAASKRHSAGVQMMSIDDPPGTCANRNRASSVPMTASGVGKRVSEDFLTASSKEDVAAATIFGSGSRSDEMPHA